MKFLLLIIFSVNLFCVEKIISIGPEITEMLLQLELKNKIVSSDSHSKEKYYLYTEFNSFDNGELDNKVILKLMPDLVIISNHYNLDEQIDELKKNGIKVFVTKIHNTKDDFIKDLRDISKLAGTLNKAVDLETDYNTKIIEIDMLKLMNDISSKVIFIKYQDGKYVAAPSNSPTDSMIKLISCTNLNKSNDWVDATSLLPNADLILIDKETVPKKEIEKLALSKPTLEVDYNMYEYYSNTPDILLNILNNVMGLKF